MTWELKEAGQKPIRLFIYVEIWKARAISVATYVQYNKSLRFWLVCRAWRIEVIIVVWSRCQQKLNRGASSRVINPDICTVSTASLHILIYSQTEGMDTKPEAEFIVPNWGDKVNSGCRTGPPSYIGWRAGTTTLCRCQLYPPPPVRDYEFGYNYLVFKMNDNTCYLMSWRWGKGLTSDFPFNSVSMGFSAFCLSASYFHDSLFI